MICVISIKKEIGFYEYKFVKDKIISYGPG